MVVHPRSLTLVGAATAVLLPLAPVPAAAVSAALTLVERACRAPGSTYPLNAQILATVTRRSRLERVTGRAVIALIEPDGVSQVCTVASTSTRRVPGVVYDGAMTFVVTSGDAVLSAGGAALDGPGDQVSATFSTLGEPVHLTIEVSGTDARYVDVPVTKEVLVPRTPQQKAAARDRRDAAVARADRTFRESPHTARDRRIHRRSLHAAEAAYREDIAPRPRTVVVGHDHQRVDHEDLTMELDAGITPLPD